MLTWIAVSTLSLATAQDAVQSDLTKELTDLVAKAAKVESYRFVSVSETEREGGGGGGGFGGGRGGGEPQPVSGIYKKGLPMQVQSGDVVAYKDGELVVFKNEEGEWQIMEGRGGFGRGGGGRGGEGGGRGGGEAGGGDRGGRDAGDRGGFGGMRAMFGLMRTTAPHEQLAELPALTASCEKRIVTATPATAAGAGTPEKTFYAGKLTEAGAQSLGGRGGGRGGRGGGGGPEMTYEGTYELEVTGGVLTGAVIEITRSGTFGENSFVMTTTQKVTLDEVGTAELEIPDGALALFEI